MTFFHLWQRIIEQLDELNEQQATVSDLTQALTDMQVCAHTRHDCTLSTTLADDAGVIGIRTSVHSPASQQQIKCISTFLGDVRVHLA